MEDKNTTLKTWRVFAWRPFSPPGEDTTDGRRKHATYKCVVYLHGGAKGRHAKTRQMVTFSCFRMATFCPATRKYATFHALRFRLLFVVSLPGGAKGRHAKTRQHHHFAGFRVSTFRAFSPKTRLYKNTTWHKSATIISLFSLIY